MLSHSEVRTSQDVAKSVFRVLMIARLINVVLPSVVLAAELAILTILTILTILIVLAILIVLIVLTVLTILTILPILALL
ncbi:hypothetical protein CKAH01_12737 [Colletotrichum kahawae]|uniref:Uncharacterized protein n=1 Tax=Colletotrichum kahawae TaxID=34407 RepID=A0AAD9YSW2_COLKA|nr:hypothetical protein CKAH01_12737 [Colletotrichum kahawae]